MLRRLKQLAQPLQQPSALSQLPMPAPPRMLRLQRTTLLPLPLLPVTLPQTMPLRLLQSGALAMPQPLMQTPTSLRTRIRTATPLRTPLRLLTLPARQALRSPPLKRPPRRLPWPPSCAASARRWRR
jgi:hypothetical protein